MRRSDEFYEREEKYYMELARCLKNGNLTLFKKLLNDSIDFNIHLDLRKIPRRFELISELLLDCTKRVTNGEISALGEQITILRFCNDIGLLEKELTQHEILAVNKIKKDKLFLANIVDLFGRISDSFISYINLVLPQNLYKYFNERFKEEYIDSPDPMMNYIKNFFNYYSIYGLVVRNLGSIKGFIDTFKKNYILFKNQKKKDQLNSVKLSEKFVEFSIIYRTFYFGDDDEHEYRNIKKHLVSPENILKNINNILAKDNYNFYSLSMVLLGGLGPQGLGFTYSSPKGEVIEICSDQKETEAIIIEFKQYQKRKFLKKLENELYNIDINIDTRDNIINYLSDILNPKKLINYHHKDLIISNIKKYLYQFHEFQNQNRFDLENLLREVSQAISIILRKIKLKDQFITRMDLVAKDKIKSEDIAKLTSLRGKSHYDVLRERFFYQYIVDWFFQIYQDEKSKSIKEF
ncbi:MAG: hypothetical protein ACFFG0_21400 [Candidatus Thorarchaeota archaeon]